MKVVLDAGHGGFDKGIVVDGRKEKDDNLDLVLAVGKLLSEKGINVGYTRVNDEYASPLRKAQIANEQGADLLVSFHRNYSREPNQCSGVKSFIYQKGTISEKIANQMNKNLEKVGFQNLGVVARTNQAILRKSDMPAILIEVGSINNAGDNQLFDRKFDQIADTIASAIYEGMTGEKWSPTVQNENSVQEVQTVAIEEKYIVQFSLFQEHKNAERFIDTIPDIGYPLCIAEKGFTYAVQAADIETLAQATSLESDLKILGYDTILMHE